MEQSQTGTSEIKMQWFDALTGRIGYSWQPNSLLYFQGGAVWARVQADLALTTTVHRRYKLYRRLDFQNQNRLDDWRWLGI